MKFSLRLIFLRSINLEMLFFPYGNQVKVWDVCAL